MLKGSHSENCHVKITGANIFSVLSNTSYHELWGCTLYLVTFYQSVDPSEWQTL